LREDFGSNLTLELAQNLVKNHFKHGFRAQEILIKSSRKDSSGGD